MAAWAWLACAQPAGSDALDAYLSDRGLDSVLATVLRERLRTGVGEERARSAEALGRLYVRMLEKAGTPEERQELEQHSRELLKLVPEADSFELRINLGKATYLQAEEIAERERLKIATPEETAEAQRVLRGVGAVFEEIASKAGAKVSALERQETIARDADIEAVRAELSEARRLRSLARYYAGWTEYYLALLTGAPSRATKAIEHFGWILNAVPGRPPSLDRLSDGLLRYEHVARAAMGVALCLSMAGNDSEAVRWLENIEHTEGLPPPVLDQLFLRKVTVLGAAGRWADVDLAVRRRREPEKDKGESPLSTAEARLLAVMALRGAREEQSRPGLRRVAERLAQTAMADLITRGEVGHVLDLVQKFGTLPIGEEGFISVYVRGLQTFEQARAEHRAAGGDAEAPSADNATINRYREAARLLESVDRSEDAARFPNELVKARMRRGLALYYAGDLEAAAEQFQRAAAAPAGPEQRQDALWYGVVTLDRAVEAGKPSLVPQRDALATVYLREFPGSANAARLLLRQVRADLVPEEKAIEILMNVPGDSPLYEAARRQAARMLYQAFRRAGPERRDFAALRFADVAEQVLAIEAAKAGAGTDRPAREAAENVLVLVRQTADALLASSAPDLARVEAALAVLDSVATRHGMDLAHLGGELAFRRLQIALARSDPARIQRAADEVRAIGGAYGAAADRLLYRRAMGVFLKTPEDAGSARDVVRFGTRVLDASPGVREAGDPAAAGLRNSIAAAAFTLWRLERDESMRDLALEMERTQHAAQVRTSEGLRRLAELAEEAGAKQEALDAWRELLVGLDDTTPAWFEARYHSIRLLMESDPAGAADAMTQHKVLHPEFGPAPWGEKLRELDALVGGRVPAMPQTPAGAPR